MNEKLLTVVKRNGRRERIDIQKIQKQTKDATQGLDNVNQSELEVDAKIHFKDGITTEEIQKTLIKTAIDKIDIDAPNWSFVASRLFLYDLYHKVSGFTGYKHLKDYLEIGIREGRILEGFANKYDLDLLNSVIDPQRDLQFNYLGIKTLYDRYLLKDKNDKPIELPQQMFMGIAMYLASNEKDCNKWAIEFYNILSKFEVMIATPTLSNARTPRHQLSSCFLNSFPDNIEGIFDIYKEMALLSKYGGGIGTDITKIRSIGSYIDSHKNASGGVVPFLKIVNDIALAIDQLGTRKGAIATYLEIWHMDIMDFIDLRKNSGEERRRTHDLFPAVWICDLFMKRVEENALWTLFDPYEVSELSNVYGKEFEDKYIELEKKENITKEVVQAKGLWKKILTNYFESGLPFLGFKDTANRTNPNSHTGIIRSSNLCVSGKTKILTKDYGYIPIAKIVKDGIEELDVWNGEEWSKTKVFKTNEKAKVLKVVLSNYHMIDATEYHKWHILDSNDKVKVVNTLELKQGDRLVGFKSLPLVPHGKQEFKNAYANGLLSAGGTTTNKYHMIYLYPKNNAILEYVSNYKNAIKNDKRIIINYNKDILQDKFFIPDCRYKLQDRLDWLAGLFDGDGSLIDNEYAKGIEFSSISLNFIKRVNLMLQELGVDSKVFKETDILMPDIYKIFIDIKGCNTLLELGYRAFIVIPKKDTEYEDHKDTIKVISITPQNKLIPTYCGTEPKLNRLTLNGVITGNCTEIFQNTNPQIYKVEVEYEDGSKELFNEDDLVTTDNNITKKANKLTSIDTLNNKKIFITQKIGFDGDTAVCNLASVNLSKINTREDIQRVVPIAIRMLDNVIDLNYYPSKKAKITNNKTRAIGLGVMGEAEMLASKAIYFGSNEHLKIIDNIMEAISYYAIDASSNLAKEKGKYKEYEGSNWSKGIFPIDVANPNALKLIEKDLLDNPLNWEELRDKVKSQGIRNGYLMAIAPTSSISILVGTTQTIEPIYSKKWFEENTSGMIANVVPNLTLDTFNYYISAYELDQRDIIKAASIRQKWIDQGQSINIFMKLDNASGKVLNDIYMLAWRLGIKSTYYLRTQSPDASKNTEVEIMDRSIECYNCQ